jgi:hypothetical protein
MVGLCLVAVFAIAAVAATSASALPEWAKCEKVAPKTGAYTDANCTVKAKPLNSGEFKLRKGKELANVPFSGHNVGSGGLLTTGVIECNGGTNNRKLVPRAKCVEGGGEVEEVNNVALSVECEAETSSGEAHSTKSIVNVHVTFTGCKIFGSAPCQGAGLAEGEIRTNPLKGELGYISKAKHEVGVRLTPVKAKGHFADFSCPGVGLTIHVGVGNAKQGAAYLPETTGGHDGIISPITPVNSMTSTYEQVYTVNHELSENIPSKFEGKPISLLEDYATNESGESLMWTRAGEEITNVNTPAEPGEIKA